jgi:hypothetical protein
VISYERCPSDFVLLGEHPYQPNPLLMGDTARGRYTGVRKTAQAHTVQVLKINEVIVDF